MGKYLDTIKSPEDLKKLKATELPALAKEIRKFLLGTISKTGGHLASNLGVVELTIALHYCFSTPEDKIIWDVGHQAYVHKILTGRQEAFSTLRKYQGLSGFPKPKESIHDFFITGHSSTSISAALGFACARDLAGKNNCVIAVIGDGSMTGGLAYEALNNAGQSNRNLIVILNDNEMSISNNVGAISKHLGEIRMKPGYLGAKKEIHELLNRLPVLGKPIDRAIERTKNAVKYFFVTGVLFEEMGFRYVGPIDGHNLPELLSTFQKMKTASGPILIHVRTKKGKGYKYAEQLPWEYHGVGSFQIKTGEPVKKEEEATYSEVFGQELERQAAANKKIIAISAAMTGGTGLSGFAAHFSERFFDVGIAEQHAVTFAAGLAAQGYIPIFAVYSTFLQRAYDQMIHDVCLQNLHVIFAIDRAGLVGADGETHQGIFDLAFLSHIPNMTILSPKDGVELRQMLQFAVQFTGPIAIRYAKGNCALEEKQQAPIVLGKAELLKQGQGIAIFALGCMVETAEEVCQILEKEGHQPFLVNARFVKPLDMETLYRAAKLCKLIVTVEDHVRSGGFGAQVLAAMNDEGILVQRVLRFAFPDCYVEQGTREELFAAYGLDAKAMAAKILKEWENIE